MRHFLTLVMMSDFLAKPLQGHLFCKFRDTYLGHERVATLAASLTVPIEERAEDARIDPACENATTAVHITGTSPKDATYSTWYR